MGGMTRFTTIEEFDEKMLCGNSTLAPRLVPAPVRVPQPQPRSNQSIYEVQKNLSRTSFQKYSS